MILIGIWRRRPTANTVNAIANGVQARRAVDPENVEARGMEVLRAATRHRRGEHREHEANRTLTVFVAVLRDTTQKSGQTREEQIAELLAGQALLGGEEGGGRDEKPGYDAEAADSRCVGSAWNFCGPPSRGRDSQFRCTAS